MRFDFTLEQRMLVDMTKEFVQAEVAPLDEQMDKTANMPPELLQKMRAFYGLVAAQEYGGAGADTLAAALVMEELAKGSASVAITMDAQWLGTEILMFYGSEAQKQKYLPLAASEKLMAFSLTEPGAGSDVGAISSGAIMENDCWLLNGSKAWCTNAGLADLFIVLAKTDKDKGARGISAFIVEADTPGFIVNKKEDKMGGRGASIAGFSMNNCRIDKDSLLGQPGMGFAIAMHALDGARINLAAIAIGISAHAMQIAKDYAHARKAFGRPLADLQAVQFMVAGMASRLYANRLMVQHTARLRDSGKAHSKEAAITKATCSQNAVKTCLDAIQILGANGYSKDNAPERLLRDAKLTELGDGSTEVLKMFIGRAELGS